MQEEENLMRQFAHLEILKVVEQQNLLDQKVKLKLKKELLLLIVTFTFHQKKQNNLRSEQHTSELQSRPHLVCRLLLEKKKKTKIKNTNNISKKIYHYTTHSIIKQINIHHTKQT